MIRSVVYRRQRRPSLPCQIPVYLVLSAQVFWHYLRWWSFREKGRMRLWETYGHSIHFEEQLFCPMDGPRTRGSSSSRSTVWGLQGPPETSRIHHISGMYVLCTTFFFESSFWPTKNYTVIFVSPEKKKWQRPMIAPHLAAVLKAFFPCKPVKKKH